MMERSSFNEMDDSLTNYRRRRKWTNRLSDETRNYLLVGTIAATCQSCDLDKVRQTEGVEAIEESRDYFTQ